MSQTSATRLRQLTDYALDRRIVAEIRMRVRLNGVSRSLSMTDDRSDEQETIAVWVSDLSRLAESLGVRSATPA